MDNAENLLEENQEIELNYVGGNSRLSPEEREIVLIMDDKDRKWKASCSSPTYMKKFENRDGNASEKIITGTEQFVLNFMKHHVNQFQLADMSAQNVILVMNRKQKCRLQEDKRQICLRIKLIK